MEHIKWERYCVYLPTHEADKTYIELHNYVNELNLNEEEKEKIMHMVDIITDDIITNW